MQILRTDPITVKLVMLMFSTNGWFTKSVAHEHIEHVSGFSVSVRRYLDEGCGGVAYVSTPSGHVTIPLLTTGWFIFKKVDQGDPLIELYDIILKHCQEQHRKVICA